MRFAICNETFQGWSWERTCRFVSETGYTGVEIAPFTFAEDIRSIGAAERSAIRETAERFGLEIVGLHWLLVSPKGLSVTCDDASVRRETADYLVALVEFCSDLGARVMVFGSPAQRRLPDDGLNSTATERLIGSIRPALDRASDLGIVMCLEPLPPPESDFLLTLEEARNLIERLSHPAARTIFDVKSASAENRPLDSLIASYFPIISHVHANDANRRGPGFGDSDFRPILRALHASGYAGWISVEVFDYTPDPETIARESLRYLMACMPGGSGLPQGGRL